uniref:Loxtox protein n=1 Tax=Loxosceles similis TaxID=321804 RepID=A0A1B2ASA7_LOXSM|nr:loxtox protein [Loxosceles similis]
MLFLVFRTLCCWILILQGAEADVSEMGENRRPIWNIARTVNAEYPIDMFLEDDANPIGIAEFLDFGANALQIEVMFDSSGTAQSVSRKSPCDCSRTCVKWIDFSYYLDDLRHFTTPDDSMFREELVLIVLDLKVSDFNPSLSFKAGKDLAQKLLDHYWQKESSGARAYILLSVPSTKNAALIRAFNLTLQKGEFAFFGEKVGIDISGDDDLFSVRRIVERLGMTGWHVWQSDVITNCLLREKSQLREAVEERDSQGYMNKVYTLTADRHATIRNALRAGVDGVMTNFPNHLTDVLKETEFKDKFKLATYDDSPWETYMEDTEYISNTLNVDDISIAKK